MARKPSQPYDVRITALDLKRALKPDIQINHTDLDVLDSNIIHLTKADLSEFEKSILRILWEDLPLDLTNSITDCYHGTSKAAAEKIQAEGFRVGSGNALGSGIYFSIGDIGYARGYTKQDGVIIQARVSWGKVGYLDDVKIAPGIRGSGDAVVDAARKYGIDTIIQSSKYSKASPTIGVVLGKFGTIISKPRIEVINILTP